MTFGANVVGWGVRVGGLGSCCGALVHHEMCIPMQRTSCMQHHVSTMRCALNESSGAAGSSGSGPPVTSPGNAGL